MSEFNSKPKTTNLSAQLESSWNQVPPSPMEGDHFRRYLGSIQPHHFPLDLENWNVTNGILQGSKQDQFYIKFEKKKLPDSIRAAVVLHGFGEHCGRYLHLPHYLEPALDVIFMYDHIGHGRSGGLRGFVEHFDDFVVDAKNALERVLKDYAHYSNVQLNLIAHSMGGLIALNLLNQFPELPLKKVALSAPYLKLKQKVPFLKKWSGLLIGLILPNLQLDAGVNAKVISHDSIVQLGYLQDALIHHFITPSLFKAMLHGMRKMDDWVKKLSPEVKQSLFFQIPLDDLIVDAQRTLKFFEQVPAVAKTKQTYPDFYHEIYNETKKEQPLADLCQFLSK